jgi:hypothetical protein
MKTSGRSGRLSGSPIPSIAASPPWRRMSHRAPFEKARTGRVPGPLVSLVVV